MKNIFITGATGYIGGLLVDKLITQSGLNLFLLCRDESKIKPEWRDKVALVSGSLENFVLPENIDFYAVVHLAAYIRNTPADILHTTNVEGIRRLCDKFVNTGIKKFIYLSSVSVFAGHLENGVSPITADLPYKAADDYGQSKIAAEKILFEYKKIPSIIIRSAFVYDENKYLNIVRNRLLNLNFKIVVTKKNNYWHILNSALLIEKITGIIDDNFEMKNNVFFLADTHPVLIRKFYNEIADDLKVKKPYYLNPLVFAILLKINNIFRLFGLNIDINNNVVAVHKYNEIYSNIGK